MSQHPHPVDLLGDVREMEVRSERAHQHRRGVERDAREQFLHFDAGRVVALVLGLLALLGQRPDALDEFERVLPPLPDE